MSRSPVDSASLGGRRDATGMPLSRGPKQGRAGGCPAQPYGMLLAKLSGKPIPRGYPASPPGVVACKAVRMLFRRPRTVPV